MQAKKTRIKAPAVQAYVPQDGDECARLINEIGRKNREIAAIKKAMNDEIAQVTDRYTGQLTPFEALLAHLTEGVQIYCEANRDELTRGGKSKSGEFITGAVQWRQRPPSVTVRGVDAVIETLLRLGLSRFVRTKEEINKEAILNEPDAIKGVAGLGIKTGTEDFVIVPFENDI